MRTGGQSARSGDGGGKTWDKCDYGIERNQTGGLGWHEVMVVVMAATIAGTKH